VFLAALRHADGESEHPFDVIRKNRKIVQRGCDELSRFHGRQFDQTGFRL
jgi:hypothetical protein